MCERSESWLKSTQLTPAACPISEKLAVDFVVDIVQIFIDLSREADASIFVSFGLIASCIT